MIRSRRPLRAVAILVLCVVPSVLTAQVATTTDTSRRQQTLFTAGDAVLAAGFVGLTVALLPADKYVARHLRNRTAPPSKVIDRAASAFEVIAFPGALVVGPAIYAYGRYAKHPGVADLGWHGTEAVLVGAGITGLLKGVLGRVRPDSAPDIEPTDFRLGGGFRDRRRTSFPSGHTTTAFAAAAAVTSEVNRMWPRWTWYVAPVMYGGATLVGLSRMYHNRHWASDVALGAGVGTFSGLKVVKYSHSHPDNLVDRIILRTTVAPDGRGGAYIMWSAPAPR